MQLLLLLHLLLNTFYPELKVTVLLIPFPAYQHHFNNNYPVAVADVFNNIANIYQSQNNYNKALSHYLQAVEIYRNYFKDGHPNLANFLFNIGLIFFLKRNYKNASIYYQEALRMKKLFAASNDTDIITLLNNIKNLNETLYKVYSPINISFTVPSNPKK